MPSMAWEKQQLGSRERGRGIPGEKDGYVDIKEFPPRDLSLATLLMEKAKRCDQASK